MFCTARAFRQAPRLPCLSSFLHARAALSTVGCVALRPGWIDYSTVRQMSEIGAALLEQPGLDPAHGSTILSTLVSSPLTIGPLHPSYWP